VCSKKKSRTATVAIVFAMVAVSVWIMIPYLRGLRNLGYVDSAIGTLRTLVAEESRFAEAHHDLGYTCAISDLDSSDLDSNRMLKALAKSGQRNGYAFELICSVGNTTGARRAFQVTARPLHADMPAYCTDQSGVVRADYGGSPSKCLLSGTPL
jgi:hypothetical protein